MLIIPRGAGRPAGAAGGASAGGSSRQLLGAGVAPAPGRLGGLCARVPRPDWVVSVSDVRCVQRASSLQGPSRQHAFCRPRRRRPRGPGRSPRSSCGPRSRAQGTDSVSRGTWAETQVFHTPYTQQCARHAVPLSVVSSSTNWRSGFPGLW